jgi:hypothetical protein
VVKKQVKRDVHHCACKAEVGVGVDLEDPCSWRVWFTNRRVVVAVERDE